MNKLLAATALLTSGLLVGCTPRTAVYQPPQAPNTSDFSRDVNASFDTTWTTITNVAGATFFSIKNFDKGSGLMTLGLDNMRGNFGSYVTCGEVESNKAARINAHPNPKSAINFMSNVFDIQLSLGGSANVMARPTADNKTSIQINSQYVLDIYEVRSDKKEHLGTWHFTSREPATQKVDINYKSTSITCQSSNKLEHDFLNEVVARLPSNVAPPIIEPSAGTSKKRSRK